MHIKRDYKFYHDRLSVRPLLCFRGVFV